MIRRMFKSVLRLFPKDDRKIFEAEMLAAFDEAVEDRRRSGRGAVMMPFALAELTSLASAAAAEWMVKLACAIYQRARLAQPFSVWAEYVAKLTAAAFRTNGSFNGRLSQDFRRMRPLGIPFNSFYVNPLRRPGSQPPRA